LLYSFGFDYGVMRVRVKGDGLKLNGAQQVLVCVGGVNNLGGRVHTVKKKYVLFSGR
jgi:hypothetical protein